MPLLPCFFTEARFFHFGAPCLAYGALFHQTKTMNHPSKELFLQWYKEAASAPLEWLLATFDESKKHPEYTLLSSFLARCISGKYGSEGENPEALVWAERAMMQLDDKNTLKKAYGSDEDYLASVQACVVQRVRWLSLSEENFHWYKAKSLAEDMLATGFSSIYIKGSNTKDGVYLGLMLMGVYNRLGEHSKAMELGTRIQSQAQQHNDAATECRASFNWAVSTLLLSKQHAVEGKATDADAALVSAKHVFDALHSNIEMNNLIGPIVEATAQYCALVQTRTTVEKSAIEGFANRLDISTQWALLDIVQMHSNDADEYLAKVLMNNLDDASEA